MDQSEIDALNRRQRNEGVGPFGRLHPLTCGLDRGSPEWNRTHLDGEGVLVATKDGWKCPYCEYQQSFRESQVVSQYEGECNQCFDVRTGRQHTNGPCRCTVAFRDARRDEQLISRAVAEEREACAKLVESLIWGWWDYYPKTMQEVIAKQIRERGQ